MNLKKIQDADLKNKRVLIRVDFNVEVNNGHVAEEFKIAAARDTVNFVLSQEKTKVALIAHLGRPENKNPEFSLLNIKDDVARILNSKIEFIDDCVGEKVKKGLDYLNDGTILLLENVRFYDEEEKNDAEFAKKLAENFDVFINDAFSVCHRDQASVTGVAKILPSYAGMWLQKEIEHLEKVLENPPKPFIAIIGGAKIETKIPLIKNFQNRADMILLGGRVANEAVDKKMEFPDNVFLPTDFATDRLDIGSRTIEDFKKIISTAKTIVWNGPMGKFEEPPYDNGTKEILGAIIDSGAFSVVGGGESVQLIEQTKSFDKISFVSTGGGAMLEFLSGDKLPGLESLLKGS